jgi:hypothetical protein
MKSGESSHASCETQPMMTELPERRSAELASSPDAAPEAGSGPARAASMPLTP